MSGSGSSVYGFFDTSDALPNLQAAFPTSTIFLRPLTLIPKHNYLYLYLYL